MKILVVDDTKVSRSMLIKRIPQFMKEQAEIIEGSNGEEAVLLYKEHNPDMVFLDLTMPVMNGFDALSLIKAHDQNAIVHVITADIQAKSKERVMALGAVSLDAKPISAERLKEIFANYQ